MRLALVVFFVLVGNACDNAKNMAGVVVECRLEDKSTVVYFKFPDGNKARMPTGGLVSNFGVDTPPWKYRVSDEGEGADRKVLYSVEHEGREVVPKTACPAASVPQQRPPAIEVKVR